MLKVKMDTAQLSVEELENVSRALRSRCIDCVEEGVAECCRHPDAVRGFLTAMAEAIDGERLRREQRDHALALGVDPGSGEWLAGA